MGRTIFRVSAGVWCALVSIYSALPGLIDTHGPIEGPIVGLAVTLFTCGVALFIWPLIELLWGNWEVTLIAYIGLPLYPIAHVMFKDFDD